jgi:hypothetical protein
MKSDRPPTIKTFTGINIDLLNPLPEQIAVLDIAQGLSNTTRFSGQCNSFFPVAEHSVVGAAYIVLEFVKAKKLEVEVCDGAKEFLVHDGTESYICDMPSPFKHTEEMKPYVAAEHKLEAVIRVAAGLPVERPAYVKEMDVKLGKRDVKERRYWDSHWSPAGARQKWLRMWGYACNGDLEKLVKMAHEIVEEDITK